MLSGSGCQPNEPFLTQVFLETRLSSEPLEPLIGQTYGSKKQSWMKIQIPQKVNLVILAKGHNSPAN